MLCPSWHEGTVRCVQPFFPHEYFFFFLERIFKRNSAGLVTWEVWKKGAEGWLLLTSTCFSFSLLVPKRLLPLPYLVECAATRKALNFGR